LAADFRVRLGSLCRFLGKFEANFAIIELQMR